MSDGRIFDRHRERGPKAAIERIFAQSPFVLGTMGWACTALGLSLHSPLAIPLGLLGWALTLGQFRFFRATLAGEIVLFSALLAWLPVAAEWTAMGIGLSFMARILSKLAVRLEDSP